MKIIRTSLLSIFFSLLFCSASAYAQSVTISLDPINPEPKSSVDVILESYSFDVNTAMITWSIDGKTILEGRGARQISVKTGDVGTVTRINVVAKTSDGTSAKQQVTITPSSVVLLYEASYSYVPPFYEGRSLPSDGALVRVTALPQLSDNGVPVPPSSLSFTWYVNDGVMKSMSGIGKQSALIRLDYLKDENEIKVVVRTPGGNTGTKEVVVQNHPIMPLLYLNDPIFGTDFKKLIERRFETVQDFALTLEPFYVSYKESKEPTYTWFLDGLPITPSSGNTLGMRPKENSEGQRKLSIKITGPDRRLQQAETSLDIFFDTRK